MQLVKALGTYSPQCDALTHDCQVPSNLKWAFHHPERGSFLHAEYSKTLYSAVLYIKLPTLP